MHFPSTCDTDTEDASSTATADGPPLLFSSLDYAEVPGILDLTSLSAPHQDPYEASPPPEQPDGPLHSTAIPTYLGQPGPSATASAAQQDTVPADPTASLSNRHGSSEHQSAAEQPATPFPASEGPFLSHQHQPSPQHPDSAHLPDSCPYTVRDESAPLPRQLLTPAAAGAQPPQASLSVLASALGQLQLGQQQGQQQSAPVVSAGPDPEQTGILIVTLLQHLESWQLAVMLTWQQLVLDLRFQAYCWL